ncbi:hypothetical protein GE09DRAFT_1174297 [Coniochaeta sp. 2T2.1]|nr:hypothetical protein GE09DRAFT_1174297 [Coniochaeta sp. 2T2.1]
MKSTTDNSVHLLTTLVDPDDEEEGEYRFLVDGKHVKYVTVAPGVLPRDGRTFGPAVIAALPPFPPGDWNEGHVAHDSTTPEKPAFVRITKRDLPGVKATWHPTTIDHLEFRQLRRLRQNIHLASHPLFDRPVLLKFTEFPWQTPYLEAETAAYRWIADEGGAGIGPRFLGHLAEEGRVFGFILEYVGDVVRTTGPEDLDACRAVLRRLHSLGIKHGDINRHNFLVRDEGRVVLLDFETAEKGASPGELEEEERRLEESLRSTSSRGAVPPVVARPADADFTT